MTDRRAVYVQRIVKERERQDDLPGAEYDVRNTPNDWVSIVLHYVAEEVRRGGVKPSEAMFEDNMIKAAAVILAALEHLDSMNEAGHFE